MSGPNKYPGVQEQVRDSIYGRRAPTGLIASVLHAAAEADHKEQEYQEDSGAEPRPLTATEQADITNANYLADVEDGFPY